MESGIEGLGKNENAKVFAVPPIQDERDNKELDKVLKSNTMDTLQSILIEELSKLKNVSDAFKYDSNKAKIEDTRPFNYMLTLRCNTLKWVQPDITSDVDGLQQTEVQGIASFDLEVMEIKKLSFVVKKEIEAKVSIHETVKNSDSPEVKSKVVGLAYKRIMERVTNEIAQIPKKERAYSVH